MTDQQRFDTIRALGNPLIYTPNLDRLARRGVVFTNAYSTCPVCVPARYTIRTGCEPPTTRTFFNGFAPPVAGQEAAMTARCGPYLAQTMKDLGYRTFGIGKFHTQPVEETLGYEVHLHSEELYGTPAERRRDAYASWIAQAHPAFDFIEGLMGERTEMYYMPPMRPLPAAITVERWAADRAVERIPARPIRGRFSARAVRQPASALRPADSLQPHVRSRPDAQSCLRRHEDRPHGRANPVDEPPDLGRRHQQKPGAHAQGPLLQRHLVRQPVPWANSRRRRVAA